MPHFSDTVALAADGASATIALSGAEPLSWRIGGRELIWHGDPAHWPQRAPILFPVIRRLRRRRRQGRGPVLSDAAARLRARPAVRARRAPAGPGAASPSRDKRHAAALSLPLRA